MGFRAVLKNGARPLRSPGIVDALARRPRRGSIAPDSPHVLIAPAGDGNIGDDAMLEAFLENVDGDVVIVCRSRSAFPRLRISARLRFLEVPWLIQRGYFPLSWWESRRLLSLLTRARSLSVIGADIMDGGYIWQNSVTRANIARWAAEMGVDSRILGFSWNGSPHQRAANALARAADSGVKLLPRDAESASRLIGVAPGAIVQSADIVFCAHEESDGATLRDLGIEDSTTPRVVFNASALVSSGGSSQVEASARAIETLVARGFEVVLLPHVIRGGEGDLAVCRDIHLALSDESRAAVTLVERLIRPTEVRSLVARSQFVVTGRMHLSIISFSQGKPAVVVSTQGKVSGLMSLFGMPELMVEPDAIDTGGLEQAVDRLAADLPDYQQRVVHALPDVTALADKNFDGLRAGDRDEGFAWRTN